jgi:glycosyltransferase involved in cell wall biosynthesis
MRVALVHDYLNQRGGAERVFAQIARAYPEAPVYTSIVDSEVTGDLIAPERVRASVLQRLPWNGHYFRALAPLYPRIFESMDLGAYDLVISSTTAWAKGVRVRPGAVHVCYIHTVSRFVFDGAYVEGLAGNGLARAARPLVAGLAAWDRKAARRPTAFVANSRNVAERVRRYYGRESEVLPGPVELERWAIGPGSGEYFIIVSRLLPYKRIDLAVRACALAGVPLLVVGSGPAERSLRALAAGTSTTVLGFLPDADVARLLGNARALIFPGEEDYGLVPLEAAAAGTPVIAYAAGGALETVIPGETGEFFEQQEPEALAAVLRGFDRARYRPERLRAHAEENSPERFRSRFRALVDRVIASA